MKKQEAAAVIYERLAETLGEKGFKLRMSEEGFVRPIPGGRDILFVPLWDYNPMFEFSLTVGIRIDAVEDIFHRFSGAPRQYQKLSYTTLTQFSYFTGENRPFRGASDQELRAAAGQVAGIAVARILPFLDEYKDIESLSRAVNGGRPDFDSTQLLSKAMHTVILARLAHDPRFDSIVASYRGLLAAFVDSEKDKFERLVRHLVTLPT